MLPLYFRHRRAGRGKTQRMQYGRWSTESAEDLYDRRAAVEKALEMLESGIAF